jgi:nitrite reductase/ring-hydroxylating ferredoxin subunit
MRKVSPCPLPETEGGIEGSRRDFLGKASCAVLAALVASGVAAVDASAFPLSPALAEAEQGSERLYPLPSADGAGIDRDNQVILVRCGNRVYAFSLACPHQNTALRWRPRDQRFQCPRHNAKYRPDGTFISGPSTRDMDRFALRLESGKVAVDLSKLYRSDRQKSEWETAVLVL